MTNAPDIDSLADRLTAAMLRLDATEQRVALRLLRQLSLGGPVGLSELADAAELPEEQTAALLDGLSGGLFRDEDGRIVGFFGLTVAEMGHHRLHVDRRTLSAWCAWDTLFLPELLAEDNVRVTSRSPSSGTEIALTVTPTGPTDLEPAKAVVSMLLPVGAFDADVIKRFCHFVHFFASREDSAAWVAEHPSAFVLSVDDAYRLGQLTNRAVFGDALSAAARR
jgi:alkylmercury lyase